ncbi:MAG: O-methyltransferase [Candidatus Kapabacteria bacterium]|nr:O-methyltransferase [Candidatus Kapabacteria bacterium]
MATRSTYLTDELNDYITSRFSSESEDLRTLNEEAIAAGIPAISISPEQTSFLQIMVRSIGARTILEIGSLAGYSAVVMARALPSGGMLYACEYEPVHADFIRRKTQELGLSNVINVLEGPALTTIADLLASSTVKFDLVFIDADKVNYSAYFDLVLPRLRIGGLIIGDNALAWGEVARSATTEFEPHNVKALDAFNTRMSSHPQIQSTLVPLGDGMVVGIKIA